MTDGGNDSRCSVTPRRATRQGLRFRAASGIVFAAAFGSSRPALSRATACFSGVFRLFDRLLYLANLESLHVGLA
jgi:hypothetical protein